VNSLEPAVTERIALKRVTEKKVRLHFAKQKKQHIFKIAIASTIVIVAYKTNKINSLQYFNFQHCYILRASLGTLFYRTIAMPSYHLQYTVMW
jgi:hypothetical protein